MSHPTLANLIVRSGKSMSQIARDSGISLSHISKISGGTRNPSLPVLAAMSDALGCEEQDIIEAIGWGGHGKAKAA